MLTSKRFGSTKWNRKGGQESLNVWEVNIQRGSKWDDAIVLIPEVSYETMWMKSIQSRPKTQKSEDAWCAEEANVAETEREKKSMRIHGQRGRWGWAEHTEPSWPWSDTDFHSLRVRGHFWRVLRKDCHDMTILTRLFQLLCGGHLEGTEGRGRLNRSWALEIIEAKGCGCLYQGDSPGSGDKCSDSRYGLKGKQKDWWERGRERDGGGQRTKKKATSVWALGKKKIAFPRSTTLKMMVQVKHVWCRCGGARWGAWSRAVSFRRQTRHRCDVGLTIVYKNLVFRNPINRPQVKSGSHHRDGIRHFKGLKRGKPTWWVSTDKGKPSQSWVLRHSMFRNGRD